MNESVVKIIDVTRSLPHQKSLYKCFAPMPFRKYKNRQEYLDKAIPKGFHKKVLVSEGETVGQIEYAPAEASGYPITGPKIFVMNCIWVLRKARGHAFGKQLLDNMIKSEKNAAGFATVALENHWSPWFRKEQLEKLGFKPIDSIKVVHTTKRPKQVFSIYLMWMPVAKNVKPPTWDKKKLLKGETFCIAHPLYRPQRRRGNIIEASSR